MKEYENFKKFISMLKQLLVNNPLVEASRHLLGYVKFIKDLVIMKRAVSGDMRKGHIIVVL